MAAVHLVLSWRQWGLIWPPAGDIDVVEVIGFPGAGAVPADVLVVLDGLRVALGAGRADGPASGPASGTAEERQHSRRDDVEFLGLAGVVGQ